MTAIDDINRLAAASATAHATLPASLAVALSKTFNNYVQQAAPLEWEESIIGLADAVLAAKRVVAA